MEGGGGGGGGCGVWGVGGGGGGGGLHRLKAGTIHRIVQTCLKPTHVLNLFDVCFHIELD